MTVLNAVQGLVTLALAILPWLLPDLPWYGKVIFALLIVIVSISIYCVRLAVRVKTVERELRDIQKRHNALAIQFDEKVMRESRYRRALKNLSLMLHFACQNTKTAKFKDIYEAFLIAQSEINDE